MSDPLQDDIQEREAPLEAVTPDPGTRTDGVGVDLLTLQNVLGIYLPDGPQRTQLGFLQEYLTKQGVKASPDDIRSAIYRLESVVGEPKLGESRLSRLYNYVRLNERIAELESAKQGYTV